ncbi:hypothetical protein B0I21_10921 [Sphingobacterium paludis]|uniref:Uncharacterized protein n=1 Tax=Sphingobacterium paludis TaxID=1476465 RepID=A0A4R7CVJ9_9SPHI|nr:hypothetical protein B0I21_10921 [Sphingobacterium paludis]
MTKSDGWGGLEQAGTKKHALKFSDGRPRT